MDESTTALEPVTAPLPAVPDETSDVVPQLLRAWLYAQDSDHTTAAYRRDVAGNAPSMKVPGWLVWCAENGQDPLVVRRAHVDAYKHALRQAAYSPASIARRLSAISSFYQYATDEEIIEHNPAKAVKRPKIDNTVSQAVGLSEEELNSLLDVAAADGARSAALLAVLFFAGLRVGSVVNANVGDLGWNEGERTLKLTVKGGTPTFKYLEGIVSDAVDAYLNERGKPADDEPLFLNVSGMRIDQSYAWRLIRSLARQAGIKSWEKLGPHSLRHTMATHSLDLGVPLADVQDALGHRDPKTTRRYDRARELRDKRPGRALAERRRKKLSEESAERLPRDRMDL